MKAILFIILAIVAFVLLGVGGWFLQLLGYVIEFLFDGFLTSLGCLFWIIIIILLICSVL